MKRRILSVLVCVVVLVSTIGMLSGQVKKIISPKPPILIPVKEDCISFNPQNIQVTEIGGRWKIVEGSHWIFDFGTLKDEAVLAFKIIKHYKMNQVCYVGRPDPSFQYLLVSGNAPVGGFPGEDCIAFNPNNIEVKQINNSWKIVEGNHWMFDFGDKKDEAYLTYRIIKKYGFTNSCFVGRPDPSFQYMRK